MASRTAVLLLALVGLAAFVSTADAGMHQVFASVFCVCTLWSAYFVHVRHQCAAGCCVAMRSGPRL